MNWEAIGAVGEIVGAIAVVVTPVRFSGYEEWTFGENGLVAPSQGHCDEAEYARQLGVGVDGS